MTRVLNSIPLLYLLMLAPGWLSIFDLIDGSWYYPQMMLESGLLSVQYLTLTLAVTPALVIINLLKRGAKFGAWLLRRRKHFGLVSFIFATVHVLHYIRYVGDAYIIWVEAFDVDLLVGWLAFVIFPVLAATSNRASARRLGRFWKPLHRLAYPAAALSFLHWYLFDAFIDLFVFWAVTLVTAKLAHISLRQLSTALRARKRHRLNAVEVE